MHGDAKGVTERRERKEIKRDKSKTGEIEWQ